MQVEMPSSVWLFPASSGHMPESASESASEAELEAKLEAELGVELGVELEVELGAETGTEPGTELEAEAERAPIPAHWRAIFSWPREQFLLQALHML